MRHLAIHKACLLGALVIAGGLLGACDNSVEPFFESERYYAIFGFLDAETDSQYVRIEPTRANPELGVVRFDVASVKTTDMTTNDVVTWQDSLVDLDDGSIGLLYHGYFRPIRGHTYRIEVQRNDGVVTSALTTVPAEPDFSVRNPARSFLGALEQGLLFNGVSRQPEQIVVNYAVTYGALTEPLEVRLPYNVFGVPEGSGWRVIVKLTRDKSTVVQRLSLTSSDPLALHTLSIDLRLLSSDWPIKDAGLVETNVTNGLGFFGSAATHRAVWHLDSLTVNELGFVDKQDSDGAGSSGTE